MKKKSNPSKIAMGTIGIASLITSSGCDSSPFIEEKSDEQSLNEDIHTAISINRTFTKEELEYIHFIHELIEKFICKPIEAYQFANNPQEYMKSSGYEAGHLFDRNAKYLKLITALGDSEIRQKLDAKDLEGFLALCKAKGYAENYSGNLLEWITKIESEENQQSNFVYTRANLEVDKAECVIPVVIYAIVVAAEWYYLLHVYKTHAWTEGEITDQSLMTGETYIDIALLTEDEKTAYILCDKYIESEIKIIVETINKENPDLTETQLLELTNFLKKNILQLNKAITHAQK